MARRLSRYPSRRERLCEDIVHRDSMIAIQEARAALIARAKENAPYSYVQLKAAHRSGKLGEMLGNIKHRHELREQVLRFLVERWEACEDQSDEIREKARWGWGDLDGIEALFMRHIAAAKEKAQASA